MQQLCDAGLSSVTKTSLVGVLMKMTSPYIYIYIYISKSLESIDGELIPWGCGMVVKDIPMSNL